MVQTLTIVDVHRAPSTPANLVLVSSNYTSIKLAWDAPMDNGGSAITNYIVEKQDINADKWSLVTSSTLATSYHVDQLKMSHAYRFRVLPVT